MCVIAGYIDVLMKLCDWQNNTVIITWVCRSKIVAQPHFSKITHTKILCYRYLSLVFVVNSPIVFNFPISNKSKS